MASYRPIVLLNTDIKIFAKTLAAQLNKVIAKLIHPDQSGFIPRRTTFDCLEWQYLWRVMEAAQLGPRFIGWVKMLYGAPGARVKVNNELSERFGLGRGMRQGCPMSPLLFAIAIEPLAVALRTSRWMREFGVGDWEDKLALYADDLLLFWGLCRTLPGKQ